MAVDFENPHDDFDGESHQLQLSWLVVADNVEDVVLVIAVGIGTRRRLKAAVRDHRFLCPSFVDYGDGAESRYSADDQIR